MQALNFVPLFKCKAQDYISRLSEIISHIRRENPDLKDLKRYLRSIDCFDPEDKEYAEKLATFLKMRVAKGKAVELGPFLSSFDDLGQDEKKSAIFMLLAKNNEILAKTIMDLLNTRIHSTNELYRYVTSYAYPGKYITLPNFKAWMEWLQASEHIKMLGIRWALSDSGVKSMESYIKLIDIDEILEEEDEENSENETPEDENQEVSVAQTTVEQAPATQTTLEQTPATQTTLEQTPATQATLEQTPATQATVEQAPVAQTQVVAQAPIVRSVAHADIQHIEVTVRAPESQLNENPLRLIREALSEADEEVTEDEFGEENTLTLVKLADLRPEADTIAENLAALQVWWRGKPGGKCLHAEDYGFSKQDFEKDFSFEFFKLCALSLQLFRFGGKLDVAKGGESYAMLRQLGFYTNLFKSRKNIDTVLEELFKVGMGQKMSYFANLHFLLVIRKNLKTLKDDGLNALLRQENLADALFALWENIGAFSLGYEIIWIWRELALLGVLERADALKIGVVPLPKVRENAFLLGFLESPYASDFAHLLSISKRLTKLFDEKFSFEAPLVYFSPKRYTPYDSSESRFFTRDRLGFDV